MSVFAHLFPDISIKSSKLHFQSWKKISPTISLFFSNVSVNSKPEIPSGRPPGICTFSLPLGSGFRPTFFTRGGRRLLIRENFYSFERKLKELLGLFQQNRRQLEKQVFLCCFISVFCKNSRCLLYL